MLPLTLPDSALLRRIALPCLALFLAACADGTTLDERRAELGEFKLGHNIVVAANATQGPLSRSAEPGAWEEALRGEVARRFGRYEGAHFFHVAIGVDGYVLAVPGIPLVAAPRSALIIGVDIWDDRLGRPINTERKRFTVFEDLTGGTILGSGLTRTAEEQMASLSRNAVLMIENWMAENPEWFAPDPETEEAATLDTEPESGAASGAEPEPEAETTPETGPAAIATAPRRRP